jgi:hypothetical protein
MLCNVGYDMRYGTLCEFGCYTGHELFGPDTRECLNTGEWDNSSPPFCQSEFSKTCLLCVLIY